MEYSKTRWFKFYGSEFLADPKMVSLSIAEKIVWVILLCLASSTDKKGVVRFITEEKLMLMAGVDPKKDEWQETKGVLDKFEKMEMVEQDKETETILVINFEKRQNSVLSGAERVERYREKHGLKRKANAKLTQKLTPIKIREDKIREDKNIYNTSDVLPKYIEADDIGLAKLLLEEIKQSNPNFKEPNINKWADDISKMRRIDKRTPEQIRYLITWTQHHDFWAANILSPAKLRKQFDTLVAQVRRDQNKKQGDTKGIVI